MSDQVRSASRRERTGPGVSLGITSSEFQQRFFQQVYYHCSSIPLCCAASIATRRARPPKLEPKSSTRQGGNHRFLRKGSCRYPRSEDPRHSKG